MENLDYDILEKAQIEEQRYSYNDRNFVMCKSCFWCASFLNSKYMSVNECPCCTNQEFETIPISLNEVYTFDHDSRQGVSLGFRNKH